ncbi:MAG: hypothetical protein ABII90_00390 [Bacteroidota bacterium]
MAKLFTHIIFSFSFLIISLTGCDAIFKRNIKEGIIVFEITYPETDAGDLMASLLPNEMILKFKNNITVGEFNAGMGIFKTSLIAYPDRKEIAHLVKIMNKKYVLLIDSTEINDLYSELPEMKIELIDETKVIAGYKCKKAIVTFKDKIKDEFSIYYTNEIDIKNPNWSSPFHEIDGVLLEYQLRKYNFEMRLTAKEVKQSKIDSSDFDIPSDYKMITQDEMDEIFEGFKEI